MKHLNTDTWTQHLHDEAFADAPPCADCQHQAEDHDPETLACNECPTAYKPEFHCEGYRPMDPDDDNAPDDYNDPED